MPASVVKQNDLHEDDSLYDLAPVGLCILDTDLHFLRVNEAMADINGVSVEKHIHRQVAEVVPDLEGVARELMEQLVRLRTQIGPFEISGQTPSQPGVQRYWTETWTPVFDASGQVTAAMISALEITEQKRIEREKEAALKALQQHAQFQAALTYLMGKALSDAPLSDFLNETLETVSSAINVAAAQILQIDQQSGAYQLLAGSGWLKSHVGSHPDPSELWQILSAFHEEGSHAFPGENLLAYPATGSLTWFGHPVQGGISFDISDGRATQFGLIGAYSTDMRSFGDLERRFLASVASLVATRLQRERANAERELLVREMSHRSANLLQLVAATANQTLKASTDPSALKAFKDRLSALSRSTQVISSGGWTTSQLRDVTEQTLLPFKERISVEGEDVALPADLSFDLGLVLHELCTNSCKYGSLAGESGRISLRWNVADAELKLEWLDLQPASPVVQAVPSSGFGSRLIESLIRHKWKGSVTIDEDAGYRFTLSVQLETFD